MYLVRAITLCIILYNTLLVFRTANVNYSVNQSLPLRVECGGFVNLLLHNPGFDWNGNFRKYI